MIELRKVYVRHREGYPETVLGDYARRGFWELGVEVQPYEWGTDLDEVPDLGPEVGVAGYLGDVWRALRRLGRPVPEPVDYPEPLRPFLGRKVWQGVLDDVRNHVGTWFIKPVEHKRFTGFVWRGDGESRRRVAAEPDDVPIWIADALDMRAEYRCFILDGRVIDARRYKGDWSLAPSRSTVEQAVAAMKSTAPRAYSLDFAVTGEGESVLIEMNDGYSLGHYGLNPVDYARMLSARWHEMVTGFRCKG